MQSSPRTQHARASLYVCVCVRESLHLLGVTMFFHLIMEFMLTSVCPVNLDLFCSKVCPSFGWFFSLSQAWPLPSTVSCTFINSFVRWKPQGQYIFLTSSGLYLSDFQTWLWYFFSLLIAIIIKMYETYFGQLICHRRMCVINLFMHACVSVLYMSKFTL